MTPCTTRPTQECLYFYEYYFSPCAELTDAFKSSWPYHNAAARGAITVKAQGFQLRDMVLLLCSAHITWGFAVGNLFKVSQPVVMSSVTGSFVRPKQYACGLALLGLKHGLVYLTELVSCIGRGLRSVACFTMHIKKHRAKCREHSHL